MDTKRLILFVIFSASILMLWDAWQRQYAPKEPMTATQNSATVLTKQGTEVAQANNAFKLVKSQRIQIKTDLYDVQIDTTGGDIRYIALQKHRADNSETHKFVLMSDTAPMLYVAQTGFRNAELPNDQSIYTTSSNNYIMQEGKDKLDVVLHWQANGVSVDKIYTFHRDRYVIDVRYQIQNNGVMPINPTVYYQLIHDKTAKTGMMMMMPTFTGGAYYTETEHFNKIAFEDMEKSNLSVSSNNGWVGMVQHYFASAWILKSGSQRTYFTKQLDTQHFAVGMDAAVGMVNPAAKTELMTQLYAGPQIPAQLEKTASGLDLVVDYGWLTIIAKPIFMLLAFIQKYVASNWGVAIIILTVLIKAAFFKLSASGYRNMAHLRELAPKMQAMKERFGDDKQKMQQAMMDLYRKEKINPMGGCLPILIQIPVFIALYWVLMGAVELRHAPFFGWIKNLSALDPYYVLPVLMGISMFVQSKLNPTPADPIQAKVMTWMPIIFSVFFLWFPAGLVLYWLVNNILSIWQQWYINKTIHAEASARKSGGKR